MPQRKKSASSSKSGPETPNKDATYWKVLNAAVSLDIQKGHQKWTMTQLSKKSGISRTLIYYYFGSSKLDLLKEAVLTIGHELAGMSQGRMELWNQGKIGESFAATRKILTANPHLFYFYLFNRNSGNELGKTIRHKEKDLHGKIAQYFPRWDPVTYESIFALLIGINSVENLSQLAVFRALEIITSGLKKREEAQTSLLPYRQEKP